MADPLPDPALLVLIGASGSGKTTWARAHYREVEIVGSDALRAVVGSGENDLDATRDAFDLLDRIVEARLRRGLTVVVDTLGTDRARRRRWRETAEAAGLPAVAVLFDTPAALCRSRNRERARPVPAAVLAAQLRGLRETVAELDDEPWARVESVAPPAEPATPPADPTAGVAAAARPRSGTGPSGTAAAAPVSAQAVSGRSDGTPVASAASLEVVLQLSRFPWGEDPVRWLTGIAREADRVGITGIALMDHLIQIPQVGRVWEPIPEPWVTLGLLAGLDTSLRLGTLVSPVTFRPPGVTAKAAATLDALSDGRAFLGLGAGWWDREHAGFGLPFPPARERLDALESGIELIRALWSPGTKPHRSGRVDLPETVSYPRPVGRLPIVVGGSGERRTLQIAARLGDACNLPSDPDLLAYKIAILRDHCVVAGRDPADVAITVLDLPVVGTDREDAAHRVERLRGRTPATTFAARHHAGTPEQTAERYRRLADLGVSTVFCALPDLVEPGDLDRLAAVVEALRGTQGQPA
ncbi:alkanesulfonate monooxygenase SsuD/methylene tetrahydromethanopterin reductase-like flavin-dependent oxidoreductase (luciferase family)/predicted kinase [Friedmanniella endophytica]|uniref:Alkanesulfonate monooxygenase SsuD/methylene tetrahydromethanopterin reductase-like flavin-dependent oxidoreductase (Luciferase family)/predicted kinase n=1 Tax=Microlunatus kandeliicorticis TaxID=1759536 RepID=A0A7W3IT06_9ACTN|nr:LLM class flavin-dependent oxidoreductase [Microlunatus kandeliicorticis]MBA8794711.1 alkanesulfonate monooxygenase SsuD/methylene tetrahydromethanopterin reductase-like flavin-dependent oxidoreductase (luciferase family)/predicted kinase [Microlunatus kandeliicorticis]